MSSNLVIRPMTGNEIHTAIEWAAVEGWNPGLHDGECFLTADPRGFLIGLQDGKPVGVISAIRYDDHFGFIGFYIVHPDYRGKGYGLQLWQAAINYLEGCTIGLDGVVEQQDNYRQSGFVFAYRNIRYQGQGGHQDCQHRSDPSIRLLPCTDIPEHSLLDYDARFFPARRDTFVRTWNTQPGSTGLAALSQGQLQGYGLLRPCRSGFKIGPLYADKPAIAAALLQTLQSKVPAGQPFYLDVPAINTDATALAQQLGMTTVFETARMYSGETPDLPLDKIFAVTSYEIG